MNPWEKGILCLTIGLTVGVLARMWTSGLIRIYKLLFCYLGFDFLSSLAGLVVPYHTTAYGYYYFAAQTLKIIIAAAVLVEIYSLALEQHKALATFGKSVVGYILAAAALLPIAGLLADRAAAGNPHPVLRAFFLFEQSMDATIAIFLILISLFMAWFPIKLRRNVIVYISGFVIWTLTRSAAVHLTKQFLGNQRAIRIIDSFEIVVPVACLLLWLVEFRREGENRTAVVGHLWNRAEADRLTGQLTAINDSLERLRRNQGREELNQK